MAEAKKVNGNKFQQLLAGSSKDIREQRANMIATQTQKVQETLVRNLMDERDKLEWKLMELTDISRDSDFSLMVTKKDFNADEWARNVQTLKVQLLDNEIQLTTAKETLKEWFGVENPS